MNNIIDLIRPLFPTNAEFRTESNAPIIGIDWKLNNDPERPGKRSRTICLQISDEFLEDYRDGDEGIRSSMERGLVASIAQRLKSFEPDHGSLAGNENPKEFWQIS